MKSIKTAAFIFLAALVFYSCSSDNTTTTETKSESGLAHQAPPAAVEDDGKGIGPISSVEVGAEIDEALAAEGKSIFEGKCSACHQLSDQKIVGPGLQGVTEKRKPEWIMNMVINPEEMTKKDPTAKKLLAEHLTQMTNQNINEADARALLEFLRQNDKNS
ncbi:cytochrome c [Pontibacter sp. HSC-14F20]|uniref:c-type cytochrome n=1 Tax=Pontibacter sp. HSC-14F20 TaxID=2864136 RepID=UPI001C72A630|nr:cytochrome c [Pontibacter sp. HSC-14F20]MBX0332293.1 cytochrome c [Pontibacter sp. HSC-14F20]